MNKNICEHTMRSIAIKLIASCFKPLSQYDYWKSFKDTDNVWRKEKVAPTDKEIAEGISEKREFLSSHPIINALDGVFLFDGFMFDKKKLLKRFDEFVLDGCRGDFLIEVLDDEE